MRKNYSDGRCNVVVNICARKRANALSSVISTTMSKTERSASDIVDDDPHLCWWGKQFRCKIGRHLPDRTNDSPKSMSGALRVSLA